MRIARIAHQTGMSFAVLEGQGPGATAAEIEGHPFAQIKLTGQRWSLDDVRLLAPILPSKVVCVGRNYADHAAELGNEVPKEPLIFLKPSTSVIGPGELIRLPAVSDQVEHEAELAVVIGLPGARGLDRESAKGSIFGYTCANDVTARDLQKQDVQFTRAKGFDSFCPLGPWIETDAEVGRRRGALRGERRSAPARFDQGHGLRPGDAGRLRLAGDDAAAGRCGAHRHARGRGAAPGGRDRLRFRRRHRHAVQQGGFQ